MKGNVELIRFHVKSRGVQDLVFVQITFEYCILNFHFENSEIDLKKTIANLHPLFAWNVSTYLRIFILNKTCFYETSNVFYLEC